MSLSQLAEPISWFRLTRVLLPSVFALLGLLVTIVYSDNIHTVVDWAQVTGFDWDQGNARKSAEKHGVSQAEAERIFFNEPLLVLPDTKHSQHEPRYHALGTTDTSRLLHVTFTLRASGTLIRVISARNMHRKEQIYYEQAKRDAT